MSVTVKLPPKFYTDHRSRDCGQTGVVINETKTYVLISLDEEALADLRSDATYYADADQFDPEYRGLCASAKATVRALDKVE